jgi:hypothetical protein
VATVRAFAQTIHPVKQATKDDSSELVTDRSWFLGLATAHTIPPGAEVNNHHSTSFRYIG